MLPGKFVGVVTYDCNSEELMRKLRKGYFKGAWKEQDDLLTGYVLVDNGKVVGAIVEKVLSDEMIFGEEAFRRITRASAEGKIKVIEMYEADVDEILSEYPRAKVFMTEIPCWNLEYLIGLLKTHSGGLEVHDGALAWRLYVEDGKITAVRTIKGPKVRGEKALRLLLRDTGHIIRDGRVVVTGIADFSTLDSLKKPVDAGEILSLLLEKQNIERLVEGSNIYGGNKYRNRKLRA